MQPLISEISMAALPEISIEKLIERYAVLLLDAYGVLIHTSGALPGAAELIAELNRTEKAYFILTNDASKLPRTTAKLFRRFGLAIDAERIITSGALLKAYFSEHRLQGSACVVLGPQDSARYVEIAGGKIVSPQDGFDVLVIGDEAGFPFLETVDTVLTALFRMLDRRQEVHLVLPNPDLIYPKADHGFGIASGSIALMLEAALQLRYPDRPDLRFMRLGKPHAAIYREALLRSGTRDMVMIGDQLETDIRGANAFGIDSVLVDTGICRMATDRLTENRCPTYCMHSMMLAHPE